MIVEVSIVPIGTGETSVSSYVRAAVKIIEEANLEYEINSMGTCIQGEWDEIFSTLKAMHDELARLGCNRIVTTVKVDDRRDKYGTMGAKIAALEEGL
ncbi:MTH1187 family thiamine-binding protein [candidate division WOR-3 bacterium]|nr:MTH1187 family thiamine-binding protein [candidate division WOR-3 bacterium]